MNPLQSFFHLSTHLFSINTYKLFFFFIKVPLGLSITKTKQTVNLDKLFTNLKQNLLNKMMGVKYLLKLLFKLKKPIIGHNSSLDILILCNQFLHPLPGNLYFT